MPRPARPRPTNLSHPHYQPPFPASVSLYTCGEVETGNSQPSASSRSINYHSNRSINYRGHSYLAVDGDHIGWHTGQRRHPRDEASLELLGVERRQNVAEVVVGRCSVAKRAEPPQQLEFLLAEPGDVDDRLRPGKHCQKAQNTSSSGYSTLPRCRGSGKSLK